MLMSSNNNIKMKSRNNRMMHSPSWCMNSNSRLIRNKSWRFRSRLMYKRSSIMIMNHILHSRRIFSTMPQRSLRTKAIT